MSRGLGDVYKRQLMSLSIIAMVDEEYGIRIKGDDIKLSETIQDLYNIVRSRQ